MPRTLDCELRRAFAARIRYYNEIGIYDFYRRPLSAAAEGAATIEGCGRGYMYIEELVLRATWAAVRQCEAPGNHWRKC